MNLFQKLDLRSEFFPNLVNAEVHAVGCGCLGNEGDGFPKGGVIVGAAEELPFPAPRRCQDVGCLNLLGGVLMPTRDAWKRLKISMLKVLDHTLHNFGMPRHGERLAEVIAAVTKFFRHVAVGIVTIAGLVGNFSVEL